ncbi:hypothetical protein [Nonomuraea sp. NPDC048916]|uniref:hypothetical protein n=1 Tax=Nonomuraea sp. NPDC048916 TaxID=3154232 RepID=UPI0033CDC27E
MTLRNVRWEPPTEQYASRLPPRLRRLVNTLLAELATGPIPPKDTLPDVDVPNAYAIHTSELIMKFTIYDDEVRIWILKVNC